MSGITTFLETIVYNGEARYMTEAAALIHRESWGEDYPLRAIQVLENADFVWIAHQDSKVVGVICVTRKLVCPDDHTNEEPWLCCWLVKDGLREKGIGKQLLQAALSHARLHKDTHGRYLYASVDSHLDRMKLDGASRQRWEFERRAKNEDGSPTTILRLTL